MRIGWIDIAKGAGILLVIAGHTVWLGWSWPIYSFHLPLFFFISGVLVHRKEITSIPRFLSRKAQAIMTPWGIAVLISAAVCMLVPEWRSGLHVGTIVRDLYSANLNCIKNSSLWYLPCLLLTICFFCFFVRLWRHDHRIGIAMLACAFALSMLLPKILPMMHFLPGARLPLKVDTAVLGFCFFTTGWLFAAKPLRISRRRRLASALLLGVATGLGTWMNGCVNMNSLEYGRHAILYFPVALSGVLATCLFSNCLPEGSIVGKVLSFYVKNTLIIFCSQSLLIRAYLLVAGKISGVKLVLYGKNPLVHQFLPFVIVAFVMSPLLIVAKGVVLHMGERFREGQTDDA